MMQMVSLPYNDHMKEHGENPDKLFHFITQLLSHQADNPRFAKQQLTAPRPRPGLAGGVEKEKADEEAAKKATAEKAAKEQARLKATADRQKAASLKERICHWDREGWPMIRNGVSTEKPCDGSCGKQHMGLATEPCDNEDYVNGPYHTCSNFSKCTKKYLGAEEHLAKHGESRLKSLARFLQSKGQRPM